MSLSELRAAGAVNIRLRVVCCMFSTNIEDTPPTEDGVIFYSSSETAELAKYVCETSKGKPAGRLWNSPEPFLFLLNIRAYLFY